MASFIHRRQCTCCNNIYSQKDVTEERYDELEEDVCDSERGDIAFLDGVSYVTTEGCCENCMREPDPEE